MGGYLKSIPAPPQAPLPLYTLPVLDKHDLVRAWLGNLTNLPEGVDNFVEMGEPARVLRYNEGDIVVVDTLNGHRRGEVTRVDDGSSRPYLVYFVVYNCSVWISDLLVVAS